MHVAAFVHSTIASRAGSRALAPRDVNEPSTIDADVAIPFERRKKQRAAELELEARPCVRNREPERDERVADLEPGADFSRGEIEARTRQAQIEIRRRQRINERRPRRPRPAPRERTRLLPANDARHERRSHAVIECARHTDVRPLEELVAHSIAVELEPLDEHA
jgi:hypothetical protein